MSDRLYIVPGESGLFATAIDAERKLDDRRLLIQTAWGRTFTQDGREWKRDEQGCWQEVNQEALGIIGHEAALARGLTKLLLDAAKKRHDWQDPVQTRRGETFDLELHDPDGNPTGIVARVNVEILPR